MIYRKKVTRKQLIGWRIFAILMIAVWIYLICSSLGQDTQSENDFTETTKPSQNYIYTVQD